MSPRVQRRLREVARQHAGILLGPEKADLLAARVSRRMRALGLSDYDAYLRHFDADPAELQRFVNAITTHTTSFWREPDHFELVSREIEARLDADQRRFRIWCAAASTGQEPYTLALTLAPLLERHAVDLQILATDIDTDVLRVARAAVYPADALARVPAAVRDRGFREVTGGWRVVDRVRSLVKFAPLNLVRPPFPMRGPLDAIFCRNVLIYLDGDATAALACEFERLLAPGGLAVVGHSESLTGKTTLRMTSPSVYRRDP